MDGHLVNKGQVKIVFLTHLLVQPHRLIFLMAGCVVA